MGARHALAWKAAGATVVGVYDPELVPVVARALARMDVERAWMV
jgi:anthranilate phosphoribosyltransferase